MKKPIVICIFCAAILTAIVLALNMNVTINRGINYEVSSVSMPLYLKILDFMDRHYNYKHLLGSIVTDREDERQRAMKIFTWTRENIRPQPAQLPVVDDHVWYIIIRGYGASDQMADVFTTLCNYAGLDAFFDFIYTKDNSAVLDLSFVRIDDEWRVFYPGKGIYLKNSKGDFSTFADIKQGDWEAYNPFLKTVQPGNDFAKYLQNLPEIKGAGFKRANIQSPLRRLIFQLKKVVFKIK